MSNAEVGSLPSPLSTDKQSFGAILITRALTSSLDLTGNPKGDQQLGLPHCGQASARRVCPDRLRSCPPRRPRVWEGTGTWCGDVACSRRASGDRQWRILPTSFLIAKGTCPWHRVFGPAVTTEATRLPSRANPPQTPVLGGLVGYPRPHRRRLGKNAHTSGAPHPRFAGEGDGCSLFGETEAEAADKVCLTRSQGLNTAINHPLSSLLPPAACREHVLGEESRAAGGFPALP